jgi:hypothetical protein
VLYVNGAIKYSGTPFTGIASSGVGQADLIGQEGGNPTYFAGKISNLRLSNTVVYSTTFIPPAGPLVSTPNTRILTLQNATIVDNGPNAYAITNNGSVTTATATPFTNVNTIGTDQSPQGNNWFGNNFNVVAAGVTYDSMVDVPTLTSANVANYCVMNPLDSGANVTVTNGNLRVNNNFTGTPYSSIRGSIGVSSGKFYWEVTATTVSGNSPSVGIATAQADLTQFVGYDAYSWAYIFSTGNKTTNNSTTAYGNTITSGDIVGIALDMDNGKVWFAKNGTWQASGDPAAGTNYAYNGLTGTMFADAFAYNQSVLDVNFGQQPFVYTPPSGFVALNTYNM